ncbi:MAG: biopolymer transporter ExbD [Polyangiaceae bacterium]|nr:biopolymer transporter ExbD [Polyangiaceae bacterium]
MAGTSSMSGSRRAPIVGINVTPMVDVMLVLLVIMMVSAVYIVSQTLKVELPKTANSDEPAQTPLSVTVMKNGDYLYDQKPIDEGGLADAFRVAAERNKEATLVVTADRESLHGDVIHVVDVAKSQGIYKFAINVERQ